MDINETLDQLRTFHTRIVKPFEHLGQVLQDAQKILATDLPAAKRQLEDFAAQRIKAEREATEAKAAAAAAQADARAVEKQCGERVKAATAKVREAENKAMEASAAMQVFAQEERTHAEASVRQHKGALLTEIADLTKTRDALQAELTALRARFGA